MKKLTSRLLFKLILWLAPITIVSLLLSLYISNHYMQRIIQTYVPDLNIRAAENAALEVSGFINTAQLLLESASDTLAYEDAEFKRNSLLTNLKMKYPVFSNLYAVDGDGTEIANISLSNEYKKHTIDPTLARALRGDPGYSDILFSDENIPHLVICVPVRKWRRVQSALCGVLDFMAVWTMLDEIRVGRTGKVVLVGRDGTILSHPERKKVILKHRFVLPDKKQKGSFLDMKQSSRKLVAYATARNLGWKAVVIQDADEVFGNYNSMIRYALVLLFSIILITLAVIAVFSYQITKPITQLTEATRIFAAGDLDYRIEIKSHDEIGALSRSFNTMIADLKQSRKMLIQQEKMSSIGKFASSIAHELKGPISALSGYPYLLEDNPSDEVREYAVEIKDELLRIDRILERLLRLSKQGEYRFEQTDLNALLEKTAKTLQHHFMRVKKTHIELDLADSLPMIQADQNLLQQVFVNLLFNACEAIVEHGRVMVSTSAADGVVTARVSDNGRGIPDDVIPKIFEPFYSSKSSDKNTGLGLYITQEIVNLHNAQIQVDSRLQQGTTFTLQFYI